MFSEKPYVAVNREERHYCAILAHSLLASRPVREAFVGLLRDRVEGAPKLDADRLEVFVEAAVLRDYWHDLGDPFAYTAETAAARRQIIEFLLKQYSKGHSELADPSLIDRHGFFWTHGPGSKLWYPGRWDPRALVEAALENLKIPRWAFRAIPDLLMQSPGVAVFVEAKVESGEGRSESGYEQFKIAREIAGLVGELVPSFHNGFVGTATLGLEGTTLTWKDMADVVASSELDGFTKTAFERLAGYRPSWMPDEPPET